MRRPSWPNDHKLKKINWVLLVLIVLINSYVLLAPFWPKAEYFVDTKITKPVKDDYATVDRSYNHLVIKSIQQDGEVFEGESLATLDKGLWRRPNTSNPERGGNTVIAGHRYTYTTKVPFYSLDKVKAGDKILYVFNHKIYVYETLENKITSPSDQTVEAASNQDILTLYTCTPLWTAKQRQVVVANLKEIVQ